ncbi:MAG: hypothetical protein HYU36_08955 [Planctomycetes bacterium]|nr:hypothetical protein [Planctomycetota bacterium]
MQTVSATPETAVAGRAGRRNRPEFPRPGGVHLPRGPVSLPMPGLILAVAGLSALWGGEAGPEDGKKAGKALQFEGLWVDAAKGQIEVQGRICLNQGLIEYLACAQGGKEHESLLRLDCQPHDLYAALQSLGLKPGQGVEFQGQQKTPTGDLVYLVVEWQRDGKAVSYRAEDLIWNVYEKNPMKRTGWVFVGSRLMKHPATGELLFVASQERNIAATFHDPFAILDHPLDTGADDTVYEAHTKLLPEAGTPARLIVLKEQPRE